MARRRLVPALRALGVRRLDAIIVSHANVDHFGAVLDLADALPVGVVQVSPQMSALARAGDQRDAAARLFDGLAARSVPVTTAACGRETVVGPSRWTWLHPPDDASFDAVNDASLVLRIAVSGRTVLLCGDIQRRAMLALLEREPSLRADVIELPHHGSFHDVAAAFVTGLDPRIVLQSTGPRRLRPDRWATLLADTERLITARDGASWVEIDADGSTRVGRFRRPD